MTKMKSFARQKVCFAYADQNGCTVFFKAFSPTGVTHFFTCKQIRQLSRGIHKRLTPLTTCQELLRDGKWLYPYWDLDAELPKEGATIDRSKVIVAFEKLCEKVFPFIGTTFDRDFLQWSDSSGEVNDHYKFSLHAVYTDPKLGFQYNRANKDDRDLRKCQNEFGKLCIQESVGFEELWFNKEDGGVVKRVCMIDPSVWSTNRCMRCIGCSKFGDTRVLLPLPGGREAYTQSDIEAHLISRTEAPPNPCVIKKTVELVDGIRKVVYSKTILQQIAKKLGCHIDKVDTNLVTLKTNPGGRVCPISKERYLPGNNRCYLTMTAGEIHYRQFGVPGSLKMGQIKLEKKYEFFNDISKLKSLQRRLGDKLTKKHIQTYLYDVVTYIENPFTPLYVVKVDAYKHGYGFAGIVNQYKYRSGPVGEGLFGKPGPRFRIQGDGGPKQIKIASVLEHMVSNDQLDTYDRQCYIPYSLEKPVFARRVFNTFLPFSLIDYSPKPNTIPFPQHAIYKLMKKDLTGDHSVGFQYLLDYIAHKLQHPSVRIETALCFIRTVQGVGKGQLAKWLTMLFDERNCETVANLDHLFGRFNAHLQKVLWCFLEEIKSKGSAWEHSGRLKDLITSSSQLWEKKYHETENGNWFGQIVIFSNDSYGIRIENCDRRYVVFDTKYHYRDDKALHDLVASQTMCPDHMAEAFKYFMERDVTKWNWRNIPDTETRTAVKECCENVFLSFTRWLFEEDGNFIYNSFDFDSTRVALKNGIAFTYNGHLISAFRRYKAQTHHPSKVDYKRQIIDGIAQLWGPCMVRKYRNRQRGIYVNIHKLQTELSRQFRGHVNLEIINNEAPCRTAKHSVRLSPFDDTLGEKNGPP